MPQLTGRCLCEAIEYELDGPLSPAYNCHCSKCRRWGGDAFRTSATANAHHFKWLKGEELLSHYKVSEEATKTFCSICGTNLISIYPKRPDIVRLSLGGLEQDPGIRPSAHIYVHSKAPWFEITDALPRYPEGIPSQASTKS